MAGGQARQTTMIELLRQLLTDYCARHNIAGAQARAVAREALDYIEANPERTLAEVTEEWGA